MKISEYLTERQEKYEPSAKEVTNLRRLEKIDFEGNIHLIFGSFFLSFIGFTLAEDQMIRNLLYGLKTDEVHIR